MNNSPVKHLIALGKDCPGIWEDADHLRAGKGKDLPKWPDWCWLPMAGADSLAGKYFDRSNLFEFIPQISRIAALTTWRLTQGIYSFDRTLFDSLIQTPLTGKLPTEVFYLLPEWCVYIDTQGTDLLNGNLHGFWVHLEFDVNQHHNELRLLLDTTEGLDSMVLHLEKETVYEAYQETIYEGERVLDERGIAKTGLIPTTETVKEIAEQLHPLLSLVIYLCSSDADLGNAVPFRPHPVRTKKGFRWFPPDNPRQWNVGFNIGGLIREYRERPDPLGGTHASPKPHIRKAHWHSYWTGPKRGILKVYWLRPIPVGIANREITKHMVGIDDRED